MIKEITTNKTKGRNGQKIEAVVIHISEGTLEGTKSWILKKESNVSYHYLIGKNGEVVQFLDLEDTAWHAGIVKNPTWTKIKKGINPNSYTVGVAFAGFSREKPSITQIITVAFYIKMICVKYNIEINQENIIPHNAIRNDKECPGQNIDVKALIWLIDKI